MTCTNINIDKIRIKLKELLSEKRYRHSIGTEKKARELAVRFNVNQDKAAIAGLLHDCAKYMKKEDIVNFVIENNIKVPQNSLFVIPILHTYAGEFIAFNTFGIRDTEILQAIKNHTIGSAEMSDLDKVVYIADKIEDETRDDSYCKEIRETLEQTNSLDEAMLASYHKTICHLLDQRFYINPETVVNWNNLLKNTGKLYTEKNNSV